MCLYGQRKKRRRKESDVENHSHLKMPRFNSSTREENIDCGIKKGVFVDEVTNRHISKKMKELEF